MEVINIIYSIKDYAAHGTYKCTNCGQKVIHDDDGLKFTPCPNCDNMNWEKLI